MSTSETGNAKNIANAETLILAYANWGSLYNPGNPSLLVGNLSAKHLVAKNAHRSVSDLLPDETNAINQRQLIYDPVDELARKCVAYYASTGASELAIKDLRSLADKITGDNIRKLSRRRKDSNNTNSGGATPNPGQPATGTGYSVSQLSFDLVLDHFYQFIQLLKSDPTHYNPNETELQITALEAIHTSMENSNTQVKNIQSQLNSLRTTRDNELYEPNVGLISLLIKSKQYVKGSLKTKYPEISGISFRNKKIN